MDVMAVSQQVGSTNTQLRYRLPKVFGSLFCKCGSHSAVDNTECFLIVSSCYIFPLNARSVKKRKRPREESGTSPPRDEGSWRDADLRAFHT